jgi:Fur family ferric uptake transcriptional regulator
MPQTPPEKNNASDIAQPGRLSQAQPQSASAMGPKRTGRPRETQEAIASIVRDLPKGIHITAPEVFERAKALGLDVSLSTVYRILHRLKAVGNVMTVAGERGLRYETKEEGPEHDHLICLGCGLTIEFVDELLRGFGKAVADRKGFEHKSSRFDILGYCQECSSKDEAHLLQEASQMLISSLDSVEELTTLLRQTRDLNQGRKFAKALRSGEASLDKMRQSLKELENALVLIARAADGGSNS